MFTGKRAKDVPTDIHGCPQELELDGGEFGLWSVSASSDLFLIRRILSCNI